MQDIFLKALESGLWATLFCVLFAYQLRDGRSRECKYRATIDTLLSRLELLEEVGADVREAVTILRKSERDAKSPVARRRSKASEHLREAADV